jgi:hypothetical protein
VNIRLDKTMPESEQNRESDQSQLTLKLLRYHDQLTEFTEDCSFLCEAFTVLAIHNERLDPYTLGGFERHAQWLKQSAIELKCKLNEIREFELAADKGDVTPPPNR